MGGDDDADDCDDEDDDEDDDADDGDDDDDGNTIWGSDLGIIQASSGHHPGSIRASKTICVQGNWYTNSCQTCIDSHALSKLKW